ncbi:vWA domain-containing protein, partial [Flavobacterium frigoris]
MEKILHLITNQISGIKKIHFVLAFLIVSSYMVGQSIATTKSVTSSSCGVIDVEVDFTGVNPIKGPVEVMLVIDVSGSMGSNSGYPTSLSRAQDAAIAFVDKILADPISVNGLNPTGKNRVGLVSFSDKASLKKTLTNYSDKAALKTAITNLNAGGWTNNQDGIVLADKELTDYGVFDCSTSRSIVLLSDGVTNRTGPTGSAGTQSCNTPTFPATTTCITAAIQAATDAKTTPKGSPSVTYNNQIFSIGLFGGISGNDENVARFTLQKISTTTGTPYYFETQSSADLSGIYIQIANQLNWVAKDLIVTETIPSGYSISNVISSSGYVSPSIPPTIGPGAITWKTDLLTVTPITLTYKLTPDGTVCGPQTVSATAFKYINSNCSTVTGQSVITPEYFITCKPIITGTLTACETTTLTAITNTISPIYSWYKNGTIISPAQNSPTLIATSSGNYTVKIKNSAGSPKCELSSEPVTVTVNALPILTVVNPAAVCSPSTVDITSNTVQTTNTGTTTKYYTTLALANAGGASDLTTPAAVATTGTYYIRSEVTTGCFIVKSVEVTVNPLPTLTVVNPAAVCSPSTVDITTNTVQTTNTGTTTKYYTTLALANAGGASDLTTPAAVATTGTYYIRSEVATGCFIVKS